MSKLFLFLLLPIAIYANPAGEKVVSGQAIVERPSADVTNVIQASQQAIIEWDSFSIQANETTRFVQPSANSTVLNRVTGSNMTEIYGRMEGNGQIFLVNPYGVVVGKTGVIDCAQFLASALDIDNHALLRGSDLVFQQGQEDAKIINRGSIVAFGGPLYLIGSFVENTGDLKAFEDRVYMVAGDQVSLLSLDRPKLMIRPQEEIRKEALLSPYVLAMNREGMEDANAVRKEKGRVFLEEPAIPSLAASEKIEAKNFTTGLERQKAATASFLTVPGAPIAHVGLFVEETLDALQQMRSLIPERLWYQEFAWLIDVPGFQRMASDLANHRRSLAGSRAAISVGTPEYYFLHATVSGEPIRIMDRYLEFINSPYWKNPDTLRCLYYLQHNYSKVSR